MVYSKSWKRLWYNVADCRVSLQFEKCTWRLTFKLHLPCGGFGLITRPPSPLGTHFSFDHKKIQFDILTTINTKTNKESISRINEYLLTLTVLSSGMNDLNMASK